MSTPANSGALDILPNRLAMAEFHPVEFDVIVGEEKGQQAAAVENFNWLATYLCEEAGVEEDELRDWFRRKAPGLGDRSPLTIWAMKDGFWRVFEYAHAYKHLADEEIAGEPPADDLLIRSHQLARYTSRIVRDAFESAGVELVAPEVESEGMQRQVIHNPLAERNYLQVLWKAGADDGLLHQNYRIYLPNDHPGLSYFIHDFTPPEPDDDETVILKTGIIGEEGMDSDLDFRPPSAGKIATFVVPLANASREGSLISF